MANKYYKKKQRGRPKKTTDSNIKQEIQDVMLSQLKDDVTVAKQNMDEVNKDFMDYYDMVHCIRKSAGGNDWESKVKLPEYTSRLLTQVGNFVAKYFGSRDYAETDEDTEDATVIGQTKSAKDLLNSLLNDPKAYYFQKIVRMLMFAWPSGWAIIKGAYKQQIERYVAATKTRTETVTDDFGNALSADGGIFEDPYTQEPMTNEIEEPIYDIKIIEDKPTFDIYPNQNVYFSPEYTYSIQDKEYVIFENDSMTLAELRDVADQNEYFNLHLLEESKKEEPHASGDKTWNKDGKFKDIENPPSPKFRILERWTKYPIIINEADERGYPVDYEIGIDKDGTLKDNAVLYECIITTAMETRAAESQQTLLIGFRPSKHSKRPMTRFLCYIDALNDSGFGDGELVSDLAAAIDDNFNLGNYKTKLSTTPWFKGKRFAGIPDKVKVGPEEVTMLENMDDLQEMQMNDNIQGTMVQNSMLGSRMDYALNTSPQTMGQGPERAETATQAGIISQRAEVRIGFKNTVLEFVGFTEFYDMLLTLCNDFMLPRTLEKYIGEGAFTYNPNRVNRFRPVSQSLETEESKNFKMRMIDQIMGRIVNFPNPKTPMVVNYLMGMWLDAAGKNFKHFKEFMFSEDPEINLLYQLATGGQAAGLQQQADLAGGGPSNQAGIQQGTAEQGARAAAGR